MGVVRLRYRGPNGQGTLSDVDTVSVRLSEARKMLAKAAGLAEPSVKIMLGFPPKPLHGDGGEDPTLLELGIRDGEMLTLSGDTAEAVLDPVEMPAGDESGDFVCVRRVMPDDNSCLFHAVSYLLGEPTTASRTRLAQLRNTVADAVCSDPVRWNEGILGKSVEEYCGWIRGEKAWGGPVELAILSKKYSIEIAAFDIRTMRRDCYGEGEGFRDRVFLVYDGLHYDALVISPGPNLPKEVDVTRVAVLSEESTLCESLCAAFVAKLNAQGSFTNVENFTLRCSICGAGLRGEKEAIRHATETGHQAFQEYQ